MGKLVGGGARTSAAASFVVVVLALAGCDSPPPEVDAGRVDGAAMCGSDEACDDGRFCNGPERCAPDDPLADAIGCAPGANPCLDGQRCDEDMGECVSNCAAISDADGDGFDAIACGGADCDDTHAGRFPGNVEICDDANVDEDCDPTTFGSRDQDGDGFVDSACCNVDDAGAMSCGDDCSDFRRDMRPGFAETCDFLDNDCDGNVDEGASVEGFADEDRDLHGDPAVPLTACADTPGFSVVDDDCDDSDSDVHGAQLEICDDKDNDCDGTTDENTTEVTWYADEDADGFGSAEGATVVSCEPVPGFSLRSSDCDDGDRGVNPAAQEMCNGLDDDCDGRADFMIRPGDFEDDDGDGFADATCGGNDCDDSNSTVHPGAIEACDGIDNDCDGVADGADANAEWYLDLDRDGFGDDNDTPIVDCDPQPGRVPRAGDCDDASAAVHPGAADICDGEDDDCDGTTDEAAVRFAYYPDGDGDGFGDPSGGAVLSCLDVAARSRNAGDCDDSRADIYVGAPELCDGDDNDCDTEMDEDAPTSWFPDVDGDGHGVPGGAIVTCNPPSGFASVSDDCDDGNGARFPTNTESCDLVDNDCDTAVDEAADASCDVPSANASCGGGACGIDSCAAGFDDCDGLYASGCEVNTTSNPVHCGGCNSPCGLADTCGRVASGVCDNSPFVSVEGSDFTMFARRATGTVLAWGDNLNGIAGVGGAADVSSPTVILQDIVDISGSNGHTCAATAAGAVQCWGTNHNGELGSGDRVPRPSPAGLVIGLTGVVSVEAGEDHSCALRNDSTVWCWGGRHFGQMGDGLVSTASADQALVPVQVPGIDDAVEIVAGNRHTCVRRPLGGGGFRVQCWGANTNGVLGRGVADNSANPTPTDVLGLPSDVVGFARGFAYRTCVRLSSGALRCWGSNGFGATGNGTSGIGAEATPQVVTEVGGTEALGIVEACSGSQLTCVLRSTGVAGQHTVWCTGRDDEGQLGDGPGDSSASRLTQVLDDDGVGFITDATHIGCTDDTACVSRTDRRIFCWGHDQQGTLGNGPGGPGCHTSPLRAGCADTPLLCAGF